MIGLLNAVGAMVTFRLWFDNISVNSNTRVKSLGFLKWFAVNFEAAFFLKGPTACSFLHYLRLVVVGLWEEKLGGRHYGAENFAGGGRIAKYVAFSIL